MVVPNPGELVLIGCVVVLLFGAKKIPEFASGLGKGIKEFKKAINEDEDKSNSTVSQPLTNNEVTQTHTASSIQHKGDSINPSTIEPLKDTKI